MRSSPGVNKAGTTSLFVSLSTHPDVAPSSIKETRYFLPARYGAAAAAGRRSGTATSPTPATGPCTSKRRRRTSTAARPSPRRLRSRLVDPHALVVLREPVSRGDLVLHATRRSGCASPPTTPSPTTSPTPTALDCPTTSTIPRTRSTWRSAVGATPTSSPPGSTCSAPTACACIDFEQLVADPVTHAARHRIVARPRPRRASPPTRSAPRTAPPASGARAFQRVALAGNDRLERVLAPSPRGQAQAARRSTTASTAVPPRSRSPSRCAPSSPPATRNRTRGSPRSSTDAGIAAPAAGCAPGPTERSARSPEATRVGRQLRRPTRAVRRARAATNTRAHSNTSAMTAGMAIPESLSA